MVADFLLPVLRLHCQHSDRADRSRVFAESEGRRFLTDELWDADQALARTGLSRWVWPWGFWFAHISSPVAQLGVRPHMERVELLTVEGTWELRPKAQMLIIYPRIRAPQDWDKRGWAERTEPVIVIRPDGSGIEATGQLNTTVSRSREVVPVEE